MVFKLSNSVYFDNLLWLCYHLRILYYKEKSEPREDERERERGDDERERERERGDDERERERERGDDERERGEDEREREDEGLEFKNGAYR